MIQLQKIQYIALLGIFIFNHLYIDAYEWSFKKYV